jgi:transcriptional regulator with GAF, ATPase, and Fis domain
MSDVSGEPRYRLLYELGCAFAARIEIEQLVPLVIAKCREALDAEGASVLLLDPQSNELYFPYISEEDPEVARRLARLRFSAELGVAAAALKGGAAIRVDDAQNDPRFYHGIDQLSGLTTRNMLAAPLTSHQGMIGVIEIVNRRGAPSFSDDDLRFLEAIAGSIAIAIENARLYAQVRDSEASLRTQVGALRRDLARHGLFGEIVATSAVMAEVLRLMETAAASSITVLIQGETGTGKELVARGIHRASARSDRPFLALNCAAMPETLLESELFGHRRGAFTGAIRDNPGLFRAAAGGVVFLDEVGDMPLPMQAKLLRVLEEQEVVPLGDSFPRRVDVRVLSATNRDLRAEVAAGKFREDLYYRLAVFPIVLPPLRDRREDIPVLASRFLSAVAAQQHKSIAGIEPAALALLTSFDWPGNVRQLRNEIERAVAMARDGEAIAPGHFSLSLRAAEKDRRVSIGATLGPNRDGGVTAEPPDGNRHTKVPLREARAAFEADFIAEALRRHQGNVSRAAQALGLSRPALQKKMKDYGLR